MTITVTKKTAFARGIGRTPASATMTKISVALMEIICVIAKQVRYISNKKHLSLKLIYETNCCLDLSKSLVFPVA